MFHEGSIDMAISKAVKEERALVFFVTDEGVLARAWEEALEGNLEVKPQLEKCAVLVRLMEGSSEAAFLCAFCPAQKVPYVAVVKGGALLNTIPSTAPITSIATTLCSTLPPVPAAPSAPVNPNAALFAERKARLDALAPARAAQEAADRAARLAQLAREKARRETVSPTRARYIAEQKKIREDDIAEKKRILLLVENDKIERREKERRKREGHGQSAAHVKGKEKEKEKEKEKVVEVAAEETAISFRLLNGGVLRGLFLSGKKLSEVRAWLDVNRTDGTVPYTFQQVLPKKMLSTTDENKSLAELGFPHVTTLVLVGKNVPVGAWDHRY